MSILINQLWLHKKSKYRILFVNQEIDLIVWVNLDEKGISFPEEITCDFFNQLLEDNSINEILEEDSSLARIDTLDEKSLRKFEKSWEMIKDVVSNEPLIFDKKSFNSIIRELSKIQNVSRHTLRRLILRFWHNGKTKFGIAPLYYNSGGRGKEKKLNKSINGRPRIDHKTSIILDDKLKNKIKKGYKRWYLDVKQASKRIAYHNFLRVSFPNEWKSKYFSGVPSSSQFYYWGEKDLETEKKLRSKKGDIIFDKDLRIAEGSSANSVKGPGLSQIDSTPSDMELVSEMDKKTPIGCPTIYIISDVYSSMFVGLLITLENPSYAQASQALYNSFSNKGDFFNRSLLYQIEGFDLTEEDWPCEYIPNGIVADRGTELIGRNSENIIEDLGIQIENKESYRPELKGMIENQFQLLHKDLKGLDKDIGMKDKDDGRRGAGNARKTAKFTIREYLAIVVKMLVRNNKYHKIQNYPLDKEMPFDNMYTPTPAEVFDWGIKNKAGKLRSNKIENLRDRMLPRDIAKLNKNGIEFQKGWYMLPLHHKLRDLQLKTQKRKVRMQVSYDPYNLNFINLLHEGEVIRCELNIAKSPIYKDKTFWDIQHLKRSVSNSFNQNNDDGIYSTIETLEFASNLLNGRKKEMPNKKTNSKSVRKNREIDKKIERDTNRRISESDSNKKKNGKVISISKTSNMTRPDHLDFIERLLDGE